MTAEGRVGRASCVDTAAALAGHVVGAFGEVGPTGVADFLDTCSDVVAGLGAVRLVGADVFAPHLLSGRPLDVRDAGAVADAFEAFPAVHQPVTHQQRVLAWRDWGTVELLARLTSARSAPPGTAEAWRDWATTRLAATRLGRPPGDAAAVLGDPGDWPRWSVAVAQLSSLALPGLGGPVHDAVAAEPLALARGATRALLRRDHTTAARLARWVALLADRVPLDAPLLLEHLGLHAGADARLLLDLTVAGRVLGAVGR
ncbi:hypothetical protein ACFFSW_05245 [Saccharothrix longispora]|uniref:DNA-binding protein n=1 Tax=Saccharothrix longispora TaxID=33920 RepID=A0ABU1PRE2_9PSEU|nr:hypothetical protein [Saccharothrix longispora]MDR6593210.1 hypothetical protein [Saccharothrix longispora]